MKMKCNRVRITLYDKSLSLRSIKCESQQIKLSNINANHFFRLVIGSIPPLWLFSNFHAYDKNSGGGIEGMKYMHIEEIDEPSTLSYKYKENFN